jgi:DNA-binding LacI/PurR family transcriptional regulator
VNIYDLAREAGVSIATASKALNGRGDVNEQTRMKVVDTARRLNYHPSHMARGLARRRTENIGVIVQRRFDCSFFSNPFYSKVLEGMELEITARNYNLLLNVLPGEGVGASLPQLPKLVREKNADGLVLLGEMPRDLLVEVFDRRIPSVNVDFHTPSLLGHYVLTDNRGGMHSLVEHLAGLGHRRIALVQSDLQDWSFVERQAGFEAACRLRGLECEVWPVTSRDWALTRLTLAQRLGAPRRPSAVLGINDEHAIAALEAAKSIGLKVPSDLSVAGFDDIDAAGEGDKALTTFRVDKRRMGIEAIRTVFRLMEPPVEPTSRLDLPGEVVVRQTTAPAVAEALLG